MMTYPDIYSLIPQRPPLVMVDQLLTASEAEGRTSFRIKEETLFVRDGEMQAPGLVEHIAQSTAAFLGYQTVAIGEEPHVGYIGEIRKMTFGRLPRVGEEVQTHLTIMATAMGITLIAAESYIGDEKIAEGQMKLFLEE